MPLQWLKPSATTLWQRHALVMKKHASDPKILRGVFFDCHGTLFDGYPDLTAQPAIFTFLRHVQGIGQPVHIVSSDIDGFKKRLVASGVGPDVLPHIRKRDLWERVTKEGIRLEMLVDDDERNPLPALTHLLPKKMLHLG